jgi:chromosomal replication initiator protein
MELRTVIFKKKALMYNVNIPLDVLTYLSENIQENVRQIEGAIKTLKAHSLITGKEITLPMAKTALTDFFKKMEKEGITSDKIIDYICKRQNVRKEDLLSSRRTAEIASARHVTIYLLRTLTPLSYKSIGKIFNKDHSTIITSFNNIDKKMRYDPSFNREINDIIKELKKM